MATIYFTSVIVREASSSDPIEAFWPTGEEPFTYEYSINGGASFAAGPGTIEVNTGPFNDTLIIPQTGGIFTPGSATIVRITSSIPNSGDLVVQTLDPGVQILNPSNLTPDEVPALTSRVEIERTFSIEGVANHVEDLLDLSDTEAIDEIIYRASEKVYSFLRSVFDLTDAYASRWVRMNATYIACYLLSIRRGNPALYGDLYEQALLDLAAARDGVIDIGLATAQKALIQAPFPDSRLYQPNRVNPLRSTKVYPGQPVPYRLGVYHH